MTDARAISDEADGAPRIATLDMLRGIAILGILFMNINDMGGSIWASFGDPRHYGWGLVDQVAWWLRQVLAHGTARCLLEMLFGAGMVILTTRFAAAAENRWRVLGRYAVRNLVLFAFGLIHVFILLWPGDILHTYGLAALVAVLFSRLRPRWLLMIGLSMAVLQLVGGSIGVVTACQSRVETAALTAKRDSGQKLSPAEQKTLKKAAERKQAKAKQDAMQKARVAAEDKGRLGDFRSWVQAQWDVFLTLQGMFLEPLFIWEAAGTMLIGAALFKMGILQGRRSAQFYLGLMLACYVFGVAARVWEAWEITRFDDGLPFSAPFGELSRLAMTLGHVALVGWMAKTARGLNLLAPFVAAGRTALSIYVLQTIITLWILFPPFGLALYGKMSWAPMMLTALVINIVLLVLANIWVKRFDIAPVEWAWRSLIEWRVLPWRKPPPVARG